MVQIRPPDRLPAVRTPAGNTSDSLDRCSSADPVTSGSPNGAIVRPTPYPSNT